MTVIYYFKNFVRMELVKKKKPKSFFFFFFKLVNIEKNSSYLFLIFLF